jgi:hypothetical protein
MTIITRIYGSLLGPEFVALIGDRYYRFGALMLAMLKSGTPAEEMEMMEVDENGEAVS